MLGQIVVGYFFDKSFEHQGMSMHSLGIVAKASDEGAQDRRVQPKRSVPVI
ncbi:hypothetical protein QD460_14990 [Rhizobium jaguaris]|uniref:hypothetical protein n=1 Tax=Rhizobium jaguaris TaxID=1312183 RepID=UPI0039BEF56C